MPKHIRPALLLLLLVAALASVAVTGCGGSTESKADQAAAQAAKEEKNPPVITDAKPVAITAVKVTPGPGEGDLSKKPVIPKQTGKAPTALVAQDLIVGTGKEATDGDTVDVQYVGVLRDNGKEFDSSWSRGAKPFSFALGAGSVIQGWDQGVAGMKVGGRRRLIIPADLAYGAAGSPPKIPANAPLVFDVDLKNVTSAKS
jgi:FKBP-type peptidyl-prolyl cis-trans isomerase